MPELMTPLVAQKFHTLPILVGFLWEAYGSRARGTMGYPVADIPPGIAHLNPQTSHKQWQLHAVTT